MPTHPVAALAVMWKVVAPEIVPLLSYVPTPVPFPATARCVEPAPAELFTPDREQYDTHQQLEPTGVMEFVLSVADCVLLWLALSTVAAHPLYVAIAE